MRAGDGLTSSVSCPFVGFVVSGVGSSVYFSLICNIFNSQEVCSTL